MYTVEKQEDGFYSIWYIINGTGATIAENIGSEAIKNAGRKPKSFLTVPDKGQEYFEFYYERG